MKIIATNDIGSTELMYGANRYFFNLTSALAARGHEVELLLPLSKNDNPDKIREAFPLLKISAYHMTGTAAARGIKTILATRASIKRHVAKNGCDIILFFQPKTAIGPLLLGRAPETPKIYHYLSPWAAEYELKTGGNTDIRYKLRLALEKRILLKCDGIVTMSKFMTSRLTEMHPEMRTRRVEMIPGGVDTTRFHPPEDRHAARAAANFPHDRFVLFTARQFTPRTGLDLIVRAMKTVIQKHPDALLVIGGQGPQKQEVEALAEELGLGRHIRFEGYIPDELLPLYHGAADLFVLPTRALEGFGLVTVEAFASGTPVVGTPVGATVEILGDFKPELLTRDNSHEGVAERLIYWLDRGDMLAAMRDECRRHALESYSWETVAAKAEEFYQKAISATS